MWVIGSATSCVRCNACITALRSSLVRPTFNEAALEMRSLDCSAASTQGQMPFALVASATHSDQLVFVRACARGSSMPAALASIVVAHEGWRAEDQRLRSARQLLRAI